MKLCGPQGPRAPSAKSLQAGRGRIVPRNLAYDALHRLATAQSQATTGGNCWGQSFGYDRYGNLTGVTVSKCTAPMLSLSVTNKNRIANPGFSYDNAGNLTADGMYSYTWEGENHLTSVNGVSYTYDGDGRRVNKSNGTLYWYGLKGEVLEETDLAGNWVYDYAYFNGQRVGRRDPAGNIASYFQDPLGTARVVAGPSGTLAESDYYPFGGERVIASTLAPGNKYQFTGMERDAESGLDHTLYRQYSSNLGRWLSADPLKGSVLNPQSLNRYAYVLNNPANLIDPLGLECSGVDKEGVIHCTSSEPVLPSGPGLGEAPIIPLGPGQCTEVIVDGFRRGTVCAGPNGTNTVTSANSRSAGVRPDDRPANNGSADPTLDARANALAQAINKTGVQAMANPCTYVGFAAAAATAGAGGVAVAHAGEITAAAAENAPTITARILNWWFNLTSRPGNPGLVRAAAARAVAAKDAVVTTCNQF